MKGIQKILALAVMAFMVCASVLIVSPTATVTAEDSAQQFTDLSTGYPSSSTVVDQTQVNFGPSYTMSGGNWAFQTFRPGAEGLMNIVDLHGFIMGGAGNLIVEIWNTDQAGSPTSQITGDVYPDTSIPGSQNWFSITLSSPAPLSSGTEYGIMLYCTSSLSFRTFYQTTDPYPPGVGFYSNTGGGSWIPLASGGDFAFVTYRVIPAITPNKVAWHESGDFAFGVTGFDNKIYKFTRETGTWVLEYATGASVDHFHDVTYDSMLDRFYFVGESNANPFAYSWTSGGGFQDLSSPLTGGGFYGVTSCGGYFDGSYVWGFLAVGYTSTGAGYASWWSSGYPGNWKEAYTNLDNDEVLMDVARDGQFAGESFYAVGYDTIGSLGVMYSYGIPGDTTATLIFQDNSSIGMLNAIDWCPDHAINDYGIVVGNYMGGADANIWKLEPGNLKALIKEPGNFNDVDWHPDGSVAVIVGDVGGNGMLYRHPAGTDNVLSTDLGNAGPLYGVAMKGYTSPSSGLIVGSSGAIGFYPSAEDIGTTITINTDEPHIFNIDMWKTSDGTQASTLNKQVDVEETHTFYAEVNYTIGGTDQLFDGTNNTIVELLAWYDDGVELAVSPAPDDQHRTRYFVARWFETAGAGPGAVTGTILYPSTASNEFVLDSVGCSGPYGAAGDFKYGVWMNITFGPQTRAADGNGFATGASTNIYLAGSSQNDADSWNFNLQMLDSLFPSSRNTTYEEFGIFRFTNVTVSGSPGGNAPPGSSTPLAPNSQITCAANIDYHVNVSIPDLARVGGGGSIPATSISIATTSAFATDVNSEIFGVPVAFPGANLNLSIWGNTSQAFVNWEVPAPLNSTTAHGPQGEDFQTLGPTFIQWFVNVPGATPEGVYQATITYKIGYH